MAEHQASNKNTPIVEKDSVGDPVCGMTVDPAKTAHHNCSYL